ncbi:MAG: acetyl-CoA C-acyltransferase [Propionibacteriales bacterium]|nr:acetyl-CoA C-acyltransferase [Propionibacteriales bacterium]
MPEAVICAPLRTAVGRYGGALRDIPASALAATVIRALIDRTGLELAVIDDVVFGQGAPSGEAPAIGRAAALDAGLPVSVPGIQVDRRCGSGLQAVLTAAMEVQTGAADVVLAGGAESMSTAEHYSTQMRWGARGEGFTLHDRLARARVTAGGDRYPVPGGMIETAENLRRKYNVPREEQDELAWRSHQRAAAAQASGKFDDEIVPVLVKHPKTGVQAFDKDEHIRPDTELAALAKLRPVMAGSDREATVTAGNSSGQNDGAAVCIVTTEARAHELGLRPLARLAGWAAAGVAPDVMGIGPVPATAKALQRAGLRFADIDLIEVNEAFAAQVLAVTREWGLVPEDFDRLNVNGSGISLGHPVGATGVRILANLVNEMHRSGARYGLETMCIGGGQGLAAVFETLS